MMKVNIKIDELTVEVEDGQTILEAAEIAGIYIPAICRHPVFQSFNNEISSDEIFRGTLSIHGATGKYHGCGICLVEVEGNGIMTSCNTLVQKNMVIHTNTPAVIEQRQNAMSEILSKHPHACLLCPQNEGCELTRCISNVPDEERCCQNFNDCELKKIALYIGIKDDTPRYKSENLPIIENEPLFIRNYNLCINCMRCVRVCDEIQGVGALAATIVEGKAVVGTKAPTLKDSGCKFCGACVEVCPTGALMYKKTKNLSVGEAKRRLRLRSKIPSPNNPPEKWLEINERNKQLVPSTEGVLQLFDDDKNLICIKGTMNLAIEIKEQLQRLQKASYFMWEEDTMYAKRESELLQQYMQIHGGLPEGNATELDDDLY